MRREMLGYPISLAAGALLWAGASLLTQRAEPWDTPLFWQAAYPAAILLSGLIAVVLPERAWRWAACVFLAQALVMIALGSDFGLLPLGLGLMALLSLPAVGLALLIGRWRAP